MVISGGRIVDKTGNPWFYGDIGIRGDRIARITPPGLLGKAETKRRLDAAGLRGTLEQQDRMNRMVRMASTRDSGVAE